MGLSGACGVDEDCRSFRCKHTSFRTNKSSPSIFTQSKQRSDSHSFLFSVMSGISNFNYANPTRIVFGKGEIKKLSELVPKNAIVFMTYGGGSIKRNGVYDQVMEALKGYEIVEFGGIEANPDFDTLVKAVDVVKKLDMSRVFLLAVGGGSVADGTKFIAAACKYTKSDDLWNLVLAGGSDLEDALPMGCVMTLPAVRFLPHSSRVDRIGEQLGRGRFVPSPERRFVSVVSRVVQVLRAQSRPVPRLLHSGPRNDHVAAGAPDDQRSGGFLRARLRAVHHRVRPCVLWWCVRIRCRCAGPLRRGALQSAH